MEELFYLRRNPEGREIAAPIPLTGEVIFETVDHDINKKMLKKVVYRQLEHRLNEIRGEANWASYLVIFSPGQEVEEVRCQVDVETDGMRAGFAVGYGHSPDQALNDAVERMRWSEKNEPFRMII